MPNHVANFEQALASAPQRGGGLHAYILKLAALGTIAGIPLNELISVLKSTLSGYRPGEIEQAVSKASKSITPNAPGSYSKPYIATQKPKRAIDLSSYKKRLIDASIEQLTEDNPFCELWEMSPERLIGEPKDDSHQLLGRLYKPNDIIFIGDQFTTEVKPVSVWLSDPKLNSYPHIIPNPLTGLLGKTKDDKDSYRADSCIKDFRFVEAEFDNMPIIEQAAFWMSMIREGAPVVCLIFTGSKSIHAWWQVNYTTADEWTQKVEQKLFPEFLTPLGVDSACKNEARLSRLPGHFRADKKQFQKLLYFNPELREIAI